jgi:hypothetical protein
VAKPELGPTQSLQAAPLSSMNRMLCHRYPASRGISRAPVFPHPLQPTPKQVAAQHLGVEFDAVTQKLARPLQSPEAGKQKNMPRFRTVTTRSGLIDGEYD